jgi:ubiquinone biosynthesis monooxygenase Coq7
MSSLIDPFLIAADAALKTLFAEPHAARPMPLAVTSATSPGGSGHLTKEERRQAGALMRVNHVGEVCAQALYTAQAAVTKDAGLRAHFLHAAREETDHLAWTHQRLAALGARPSLLNPVWYLGSFALGMVAGRLGDRWSLGFVAETEKQVEAHLDGHLDRLPAADAASRAVIGQMKIDEARHAVEARSAGARELPAPVRGMMRLASRVMTTVAHYV